MGISVAFELPSAIRTGERIERLTLYLVWVSIPPSHPAFVGTELLCLTVSVCGYRRSTLLANTADGSFGIFDYRVAAAVRFYAVYRESERNGNFLVPPAISLKLGDLFFFIISHDHTSF